MAETERRRGPKTENRPLSFHDEVKRQLAAGQLDALTEVYLPYIIQEWEEIIADLEESEKRQTNY